MRERDRSEMRRAAILLAAVSAALGCGEVDRCLLDEDCAVGRRCVGAAPGDPGECARCAAKELPYDGVDGDCDPSTPDLDLDGDLDNAVTSSVAPGADCDDRDATRSSLEPEHCANRVDDDCDGEVDELDCADQLPPVVSYIEPLPGEAVFGVVQVRAYAQDDVKIARIELYFDGLYIATATSGPDVFLFRLDTTRFADGEHEVRVVAWDLRDRTGSAQHGIVVDNSTAPAVDVVSPRPMAAYSGQVPLEVIGRDLGGVSGVEVRIDGALVASSSTSPLHGWLPIGLAEGAHELVATVIDRRGAATSSTTLFGIDRAPPSLGVSPPDGAYVAGVVAVWVTASDASGIRSVSASGHETRSDRLGFDLDTSRIADGRTSFVIRAQDSAIRDGGPTGNVATATVSYVVANGPGPPFLTIVRPRGSVHGPDLVEISASSASGMDRVEVSVDGVLAGVDERAPFEVPFDFGSASGLAQVTAVAVGRDGRSSRSTIEVQRIEGPRFILPQGAPFGSVLGLGPLLAGDLDGDGFVDLLSGATEVAWARGRAGPAFGPATALALPRAFALEPIPGTRDVAVARFDGVERWAFSSQGVTRSRLDASIGASSAMAFGELSFEPGLELAVANARAAGPDFFIFGLPEAPVELGAVGSEGGVVALETMDADRDGDTDVVVARKDSAELTLHLRGPDGFSEARLVGAPSQISRLVVARVAGDPRQDLLGLGDGAPAIHVWISDAAAPEGLVAGPSVSLRAMADAIAAVDLDGDDDDDVIVHFAGSSDVDVLENRGGVLTRAGGFVVGSGWPIVADLDADGRPELIAPDPSLQEVRFARGDGMRFAAPSIIPLTGVARALASDAGPPSRVAAASSFGVESFVATQDGLVVETRAALPYAASSIGVGVPLASREPIFAPMSSERLELFLGAERVAIAEGGVAVAVGRFAVDAPVALVRARAGRTSLVRLFDSSGSLVAELTAGEGPRSIRFDDLSGDGLPELLVASATHRTVSIHASTGGGFASRRVLGAQPFEDAVAARLGGDDVPDLVGLGPSGVSVFHGAPSGLGPEVLVQFSGTYPNGGAIAAGDLDGDERSELVAARFGASAATLWIARPEGMLFAPEVLPIGARLVGLAVEDVDDDGDLDVIGAQSEPAGLVVITNARFGG